MIEYKGDTCEFKDGTKKQTRWTLGVLASVGAAICGGTLLIDPATKYTTGPKAPVAQSAIVAAAPGPKAE